MMDSFIESSRSYLNIINKNRKKIVDFLFFAILAKGIVFLTPLLLAKYLKIEEYGLVEYYLANGTIFGSFLLFGTGFSNVYFKLEKKEHLTANQSYWHVNFILLVLFTLSLFVYFFNEKLTYLLISVGTFSFQFYYNLIYQSSNKPNIAVLFQSLYSVALLLILLHKIIFSSYFHFAFLIISFILILGYHSYVFFSLPNRTFQLFRYKLLVAYGLKVVLFGFITQFINAGGRILIDSFLDITQVGIYSFWFRIGSMFPLLSYQLISIFLFRKIFTLKFENIDNYYSKLLYLIIVIATLAFLFVPYLLDYFLETQKYEYIDSRKIYFILILQSILWISSAMNELLINRNNIALKVGIKLLPIIIIYLVSILVVNHVNHLSLLSFVIINFIIVYVLNLIEIISLNQIGLKLHNYKIIVYFIPILLLFVFFV